MVAAERHPDAPGLPSAAAIVGGVGAGILESVFGTGPLPFTITEYATATTWAGRSPPTWLANTMKAAR